MDNNLQTTAGPALTISPPLIETHVSRVVDKVTCGLQLQNTKPLPGPSSEEQPRSPSHKPAQEAADPQDKTKSLVEQMFCDSQSLEGEQNPVPGRIFHSSSLLNWRGVWNKALSDFWCNAKFS